MAYGMLSRSTGWGVGWVSDYQEQGVWVLVRGEAAADGEGVWV